MTEPFAILPLAIAAADGTLDGTPAAQWVAAGVTLLQRSAPLVRALAGRRAALLLPTGPAFFTALTASEGRGAVLVNPLAAPLEVAHQLRDADVGAVFTIAHLAGKLPPGTVHVLLDDAPRAALVMADGAGRRVDLGSHVGLRLDGETGVAGRDEEAAIVYTSAMAGVPLGAILTHRNLIANAASTMDAATIVADDHALALLPFSHLFGLVVMGLAPLLAGARVTTMGRFNPVLAMERLAQGDVTLLTGVPAVFGALARQLERSGATTPRPFGALRVAICGGAPLDPGLQERWFHLTGVELRQGYGLTEAGPVCLFNRVDEPNRRGALGCPFPGVSVSIREPGRNTEVARGETGEICVRGDNVSPGYVSGGEAGLARRDGWLRTGDLGAMDDAGAVRFRGLLKPMFTRSGFNI
jgi:long-chain acyl-CoA synthetase